MALVKAAAQRRRSKDMAKAAATAITRAMPMAAAMCLAAFLPLQPLGATGTGSLSSDVRVAECALSGSPSASPSRGTCTEVRGNRSVGLEIEPLFGVSFGTLGEYVYTKDTHGKDAKLSELDWDMKSVFYGGVGALFAYKAFHLDGRVRFYFPARCGSMEDSDWKNVTIPGAANNKTNYSESENTLKNGMLFNVTASWRINTPAPMVMLCPFASFEWETLDFSAENGEGTYADADTLASNHGQPKKYKKGELMGIDYERDTILTWTGLEVLVRPIDRLSLTLAAAAAPFVYIKSVDTHHTPRGQPTNYYKDELSDWFVAYRLSTGAAFQFNGRIGISMNAAYTFSRKLEGDTYSRTSETSYTLDKTSSSRAELSHIDISIGARYRFIP